MSRRADPFFCAVSESPHSTEALYNSFTALSEEDVGLQRVRLGPYLRGSLLGQGSFGAVYEAYDAEQSKTVALKVCSSAKKMSIDSMRMHAVDQVEQEIKVLSALPSSPFIVEYIGHVSLLEESSIAVAYGLIRGENLHGLVSRQGPLPIEQVRHIVWSVMQAMLHLKTHRVVHGDIKPENVIVSTSLQTRLSDFGCACKIEECTSQRFRDIAAVSPAFQSPELASGQDDEEEEEEGKEAVIDWFSLEIWAFGIVCFFVSVGQYPFSMDDGALTLLERIGNVEYDKNLIGDSSLRDLVCSQLALASDRANLQQCSQHPFCSLYNGELPAARAEWKLPAAPSVSFVDGVHPSMYEGRKQSKLSRNSKRASMGSSSSSGGSSSSSSSAGSSPVLVADEPMGQIVGGKKGRLEDSRRRRAACTIL